jgi:purine nucleosidase
MGGQRQIIIDSDPGQDDALALFLALAAPEIEVTAVVSVAGNVPQPLVTTNSLALLAVANRDDVPVFRGCERPLLRELFTAEYVHGDTGIDGANIPPADRTEEAVHGVDHIIEACLAAEDASVTLCPVGPLTNVGMAIAKEPSIIPKIREVVWMGGAVDEPGNTTPLAEFNAYVDPHAAHIVFSSGVPITMVPLDVTHKAILPPSALESLRAVGRPVADACVGMSEFYETYDVAKYGFEGAIMHDPCAVAYLIDPSLFTGKRLSIGIEHADESEIGNTYVRTDGSEPNAMVLFDVDAPRLMDLLVSAWSSL